MTTKSPTKEELFKAGAYLGHKKDKTSPTVSNFVYRVQSGVSIINLDKTEEKLEEALEFIKGIAEKKQTILFVGTKNQIKEVVKKEALACQMPYVTERWIGGTLTNFKNVRKNVDRIQKLEEDLKSKKFEGLTKKEKKNLSEEVKGGNKLYGGIKEMRKLPGAIIAFDANKEKIAVLEAKNAGVKVVGLNDMEFDKSSIDKFVPINDESRKTMEIVAKAFVDVIKQSKK